METKRYGRFRSLDPLELQIITFLRTKDNANIYSETYSTIAEKISCNDKPKVLSALNFLVRH